MIYVNRELEKTIKPFLERPEALSVIGPRQAGKTTFIKYIAKNLTEQKKKVKFITFEKKFDLDLFNNSIEDFKNISEQYDCVIIDEFQYAKDGGKNLKYLYDTTNVKFIISGSSSLDLTFQTGKYMVGRLLEFTLLPFSFKEFLSVKDNELHNLLVEKNFSNIFDFELSKSFGNEINRRLSEYLEEYVIYGSYPAVVIAKTKTEKQKILESICQNYLLKDIQGLLNLATEDQLWRLEKFLATQIGNIIKYEELSNVSELPYKELKKHLNILDKTYICSFISPFYTNKRTELTKNPKVYFMDMGLRNFVLSDFRQLKDRQDYGAVMENYAFTLLQRRYGNNIKYWRTKSKAEVDFIIEQEQTVYPIEVKYSSKRTIGKSLYSFIEKFNPIAAIVLTRDFIHQERIKETNVKFVPLVYF